MENNNMQPHATLVNKYNKPIPRYTSYPPATSFHQGYTGLDYMKSVELSNNELPNAISIYLHIPFCPVSCLFCGCNTLITRNSNIINDYLEVIVREIDMVSSWLDLSRPVTQLHWGGGTPNYLSIKQISHVMDYLASRFSITRDTELAIECNPAHLTIDYLTSLLEMGFNRLSFGLQDFNPQVLENVNRQPSRLPLELLVTLAHERRAGVNFDFIYGLPGQTPATFGKTAREALALKPDRIVTFSYAHVPKVKPNQAALEKKGLPTPIEKFEMYRNAFTILTSEGGYIPIGLDHFALPGDELSLALSNHSLHRNFQGYCTRQTTGQVYAFGLSAISQMQGAYAQNHKNIKTYMELVKAGKPATERGYVLSTREQHTREIIQELMCNNVLNWDETAKRLNTSVNNLKNSCQFNPARLTPFIEDELVTINGNEIRITGQGRFITRNIAASFDPELIGSRNCFSGSI